MEMMVIKLFFMLGSFMNFKMENKKINWGSFVMGYLVCALTFACLTLIVTLF